MRQRLMDLLADPHAGQSRILEEGVCGKSMGSSTTSKNWRMEGRGPAHGIASLAQVAHGIRSGLFVHGARLHGGAVFRSRIGVLGSLKAMEGYEGQRNVRFGSKADMTLGTPSCPLYPRKQTET
jgi:hypothetical protein